MLIVKGKGHDLEKTEAPIMKKIGFQVSVVDDTPDFLKKEYFPDIEDVHIEDMEVFASSVSSDPKTYIIVLSRGFSRDKAILRQLSKKEFRYIGMIGSQRKNENMIMELKREGLPK